MTTIKVRDGKLLVTSSGKLATTCGAVDCFQINLIVGQYDVQSKVVLTGQSLNINMLAFPFVGVDDIGMISESPITVDMANFTISTEGKSFILAPNAGSIDSDCAENGFTISDADHTYYQPPFSDRLDHSDYLDGLRAAGFWVVGQTEFDPNPPAGTGYYVNDLVTKNQLEEHGWDMPLTSIYVGVLQCGSGFVSDFLYTCINIVWTKYWDCDSGTWGEATFQLSPATQTNAWAVENGGIARYVNKYIVKNDGNYAIEYFRPDTEPPDAYCYYQWVAYYECYSQSWSIFQSDPFNIITATQNTNVNQWVGTGGYRTMVSTSNTEPSPPEDTPTCVVFWEAYWNGTSWDKYGFYTDIGEESDPPWTCYGTEYASGAFAVGVTPDDPECEE